MLIEIKHRHTGVVLYSHECENNTIRSTLEHAVRAGADLEMANLQGAYLQGAHLEMADLEGADLEGANLRWAYLYRADLQGANLEGANLRWADLQGAHLYRAHLEMADLEGADLQGAHLEGACLPAFSIVPEKGEFIAYKKLLHGYVAEVKIPSHAKRTSSLVGRKCRASSVVVLGILNSTSHKNGDTVAGWRNKGEFTYVIGEEAYADSFNGDIRVECTNGIHFFMTKEEAKKWSA